jgi:hypothetical protein
MTFEGAARSPPFPHPQKGTCVIYAAILKNKATGQYHPILFRASPRPSDDFETGRVCRHRSSGHHTEGFGTVEEAQEMIWQSPNLTDADLLLTWDGQEMPATTLDLPLLGESDPVSPCP